MMSCLKIKFFNLIEVVFAFAVVSVAIAAILPLMTVGIRAAQQAIEDTYASDTADQILHYLAAACKDDWAAYIGNSDDSGKITNSKPGLSEQEIADWTAINETNLYSTSDSAVFGIKQGSANITDFTAVIRVWKNPVSSQVFSGSAWDEKTDIYYEHAAGLNAEISWPAEIPYSQREKKFFYLEIYKPD